MPAGGSQGYSSGITAIGETDEMADGTPTYSFPEMDPDRRLAEMILHVAERCEHDPNFGATKLNKILAFADFSAYFETGTPITGAEYMRLPQGPAPRRLRPVRERLKAEHDLAMRMVSVGKYQQQRVVPLRRPDLGIFTAAEIAAVDRIIEAFRDRTAREVSEFSHGIAWTVAENKASIPYEAVFLSDEALTAYDRVRTTELAAERGWERTARGA